MSADSELPSSSLNFLNTATMNARRRCRCWYSSNACNRSSRERRPVGSVAGAGRNWEGGRCARRDDILLVSTRTGSTTPVPERRRSFAGGIGQGASDPAELVARVALARRDLLLRVHRHRLRIEDLEDCYSQATLELMQRARSGTPFASHSHIAAAIEQR